MRIHAGYGAELEARIFEYATAHGDVRVSFSLPARLQFSQRIKSQCGSGRRIGPGGTRIGYPSCVDRDFAYLILPCFHGTGR